MPISRSRGGFTLVEVLMVVLILTLTGGMVFTVGVVGYRFWGRTDVEITALSDAQRAMDRLRDDLRLAEQGVVCAGSSLSFIRAGDDAQLNYTLDGQNRLVRTIGGASNTVMAGNMAALEVTCNPNGLVDIRVISHTVTAGVQGVRTLRSQVLVRNPDL